MSSVGRTWELWAPRYQSGDIGDRGWVELHQLQDPIVHVLVEEILGDPYVSEVTHYGWQDAEDKAGDPPTMIQVRAGSDPSDPRRTLMLLSMCFPYGLDAAIEHGDGNLVALRITEHPGGS